MPEARWWVDGAWRQEALDTEIAPTSAPSLMEERHLITESRIRRAAIEVVARRGFKATIGEVAEVAGVSPRTIIRHCVSHDRLIVDTVKAMFDSWDRGSVEAGLPRPDDDLDGWLEGVTRVFAGWSTRT